MHKLQAKILDPRLGRDFPLPEYATSGSAGSSPFAARYWRIAPPITDTTTSLTVAPGTADFTRRKSSSGSRQAANAR